MFPRSLPFLAVLACTAAAGGMTLFSPWSGSDGAKSPLLTSELPAAPSTLPPAPKKKYATPTVECIGSTATSITLRVCAGSDGTNILGGAPAGFSVQWVPLPAGVECGDFVWPTGSTCDDLSKASFSGVPGCSEFSLAAGQCVEVEIGDLFDACGVSISCGDELDCDTQYVFRAFAHANSSAQRSDFTGNLCCTTQDCPGGCMRSQGFWRNQTTCDPMGTGLVCPLPALPPCACPGTNNPTNGLCLLNGDCYDEAGICALLNTSFGGPGDANKLGRLAHQVIAVELSSLTSECGGVPAGIAETLAAAHAALQSNDAGAAQALADALSDFIKANHTAVSGCP